MRSVERPFDLTIEQFLLLVTQNCFYCDKPPAQVMIAATSKFVYNGIDRIDNELGYNIENCVSACKECNLVKRNATFEQFERVYLRWKARLYKTIV